MTSLYYPPKYASGLAGAKLTFSATGTNTLQNTYTDAGLTVASSNPVVADAAGVFAPIYLDPTLPNYRVTFETSAGVQIYQVDNVPSNQNVQQSMRLESTNPNLFLYDTDGTANARKYRVRAAGNAFEVQASNDAESVFTTILQFTGGVLYSNSTEVAVTSSGSFTGTLTGMTTTTTGTVSYRKVNNIVILWIESNVQGTSNSTSMTMTGLPAAVQPTGDRDCLCLLQDNSLAVMGRARISSSLASEIGFSHIKASLVTGALTPNASGFTNSGSKGLIDGWFIMYTVS